MTMEGKVMCQLKPLSRRPLSLLSLSWGGP